MAIDDEHETQTKRSLEEDADEEPVKDEYLVKFPPWPDMPPGVKIIPFAKWKESGIQNPALGFPDGIEKDGQGIPTCQLKRDRTGDTEHLSLHSGRKKKKKKKSHAPRGPWQDEWAKSEATRSIPIVLEADLTADERLERAAEEFAKGKFFNSEVQSIYDNLKLFLGVQPRNIQLPQTKREKAIERDAENPGMDFDDDEDEDDSFAYPIPPPPVDEGEDQLPKAIPDEYDKADQEAYIKRLEEEEKSERERKLSFFRDPVLSIRVFLSSYFRDKGLIWSATRPNDGPVVVDLFLQHVIRYKYLPECEEGTRKSLEIVNLAKIELPATGRISYNIPDRFSVACNETWGNQTVANKFFPLGANEDEDATPEEIFTPQAGADADLRGTVVVDAETLEQEIAAHEKGDEPVEEVSGWGQSWGADDPENPWFQAQAETEAAWLEKEMVSFMTLWGPVAESLVHTHSPKLIERSYRYIVDVHQPRTFEGHEDVPGLCCVELAPWHKPEGSTLPEGLIAKMPLTVNLETTSASNGMELVKETVRVLFEGRTATLFHKGIIMRGDCIKIAPIAESKSMHSWWYYERLLEVLPSYYAEHRATYIDNLLG